MAADIMKMQESEMREYLEKNLADPVSRVDAIRAGVISYAQLARLDQHKQGPPSFKRHGCVFYEKAEFVKWYVSRYAN